MSYYARVKLQQPAFKRTRLLAIDDSAYQARMQQLRGETKALFD